MSNTSRTRPAILGLISLGFQTGYEIKKATEGLLSVVWRESYGNLYPVLKRLQADGRVAHHTEGDPGRPPRQVHELTDLGKDELLNWLESISDLEPPRQEPLLKILICAETQPMLAVRHTLALRAQLTTQLEALQKQQSEDARLSDRLALAYGERVARAQLEWCDRTLVLLKC